MKKQVQPQVLKKQVTDDQIMAYAPLVYSIAYFFKQMNKSSTNLDDLIQEGFLGLLKGVQRYQPDKGVTLGAYCRRWVWGQIYRSILGSKAKNLKKIKVGYSDDEDELFYFDKSCNEIDISDYIDNLPPDQREVILYLAQGFSRQEVMDMLNITAPHLSKILKAFKTNMYESESF